MDCIRFSTFLARMVGLEASFVFAEMIARTKTNSIGASGASWVRLQTTDLLSDGSMIGFLNNKQIRTGIDDLFDSGLILKRRISGKNTTLYSINIINFMLLELLEKKYFELLIPVEEKGYNGQLVSLDLIESTIDTTDIRPRESSYLEAGKFYELSKISSKKSIIEIVGSIYRVNANKLISYVMDDGITIDLKSERGGVQNLPRYITAILMPSDMGSYRKNMESIQFKFLYHGISEILSLFGTIGITTPLVAYVEPVKEGAEEVEEEPVVQTPEEVSLKELARYDYKKYCEYMKIGVSMKTPIADWKSKDFVSYFYCGMAKRTSVSNDESAIKEEFKLPDFRKDCSIMKKHMERYGNKKLADLIKTLILDYENIKAKYRVKEIQLHVGVFGIDWIMNHVESFMKYRGESDLSERVNERLQEVKKQEKTEPQLEKTEKQALLEELRKQTQNGEQTNG